MSDADLRELERRFGASGSAEDEVRYLVARFRAGTLPAGALQLATYLGSIAASETLVAVGASEDLGLPRPHPWKVGDWVHSMATRGSPDFETTVTNGHRIGAALVHLTARHLPADAVALDATNCMDRWVLTQDDADRLAVTAVDDRLLDLERLGFVRRLLERRKMTLRDSLQRSMDPARFHDMLANAGVAWAAERLSRVIGEPTVRRALYDDLVPWALGYRDPVRERVDARAATAG